MSIILSKSIANRYINDRRFLRFRPNEPMDDRTDDTDKTFSFGADHPGIENLLIMCKNLDYNIINITDRCKHNKGDKCYIFESPKTVYIISNTDIELENSNMFDKTSMKQPSKNTTCTLYIDFYNILEIIWKHIDVSKLKKDKIYNSVYMHLKSNVSTGYIAKATLVGTITKLKDHVYLRVEKDKTITLLCDMQIAVHGKGVCLDSEFNHIKCMIADNEDYLELDTLAMTFCEDLLTNRVIDKNILDNIDTHSVIRGERIFSTITADVLDLTLVDMSNITDLGAAFEMANIKKLLFSNVNIEKVLNMNSTFYDSRIDSISFKGVKTRDLRYMSSTFSKAYIKDLDIADIKTDNSLIMLRTFEEANIDTLEMMDINKAEAIDSMFKYAVIKNGIDLRKFKFKRVKTLEDAFDTEMIKNKDGSETPVKLYLNHLPEDDDIFREFVNDLKYRGPMIIYNGTHISIDMLLDALHKDE